jgi:hypothetical protein
MVCPKAFIHGTKYDLGVYVARTAEQIGQVGYLPVSTRILTRASVVYETPRKDAPLGVGAQEPPAVPEDQRRAAFENVPGLSNLPSSLLDREETRETEWNRAGVLTLVLLPLGALLVIPPLFALPIAALRRMRNKDRGDAAIPS